MRMTYSQRTPLCSQPFFIQTIMFTFHFIISADERLCAEHKETQNKIFVRGHFRVINGKKIYVRAHYRKR